jgi:hypothetical protein
VVEENVFFIRSAWVPDLENGMRGCIGEKGGRELKTEN